MKINIVLLIILFNMTLSACAPKEPSVFEKGIFERNVSQVSINAKHISQNTKHIEENLNESKEVQSRLKTDLQ
jgi:hypothetical protein